MENLPVIKISVRNLVEFILRSGDIDNRIRSSQRAEAMQEGSRMHRKIQRRMGAAYQAEVPLKIVIETNKYCLQIEGRADGIIQEETVTIDEIKGIYMSLDYLKEPIFVHKAQAMCYAYIYASQQNLEKIFVQMTYCNLDTEEIRRFKEECTFPELENWFYTVIEKYTKWVDFQVKWRKKMLSSIMTLEFPYAYREGQKELAQDVYRTILRKKNLFIQAPTGTGKTLSTVFPAVKAVGEGLADKIFYLTAKTITGTVAKETFSLFYEKGYRAKVIQITAKEKLCLCEEMDCNPVHCPYAKGHYDRVNEAVYELLQKEDFFTREVLLEQAKKHQVCPFEMCLDTATWADDIICDYNYAFDPNVCLKRFFGEGEKGDYIFLVDEAHNLVERGREMYSADIYKEDILAVRKLLKNKDSRLEKELTKCNKIMLEYKRECDTYRVYKDDISHLIFALMRLAERLDFFLQKNTDIPSKKEVTEFYLNLRNFLNIYERVDERYVIYTEHEENDRFKMRLFCVDPSYNLQECLDKGRATVFFSATLLPIQYYKEMLSTKKDNYAVYAKTSFLNEQKLLFIGRDVSSRYTRRNAAEFQKIASYILTVAEAKKGNYMVFFPSYKLLEQVYEEFLAIVPKDIQLLKQESGMREAEREEFLGAFAEKSDNSLVAFCVLGGIFGEGIDLKEEQLIGAIIVGTGLPQIGNEREILKNYYDEKTKEGFEYAYRYPGMNKVLQAAGRVIRTLEDRGVIALLDERFLESSYLRLFPREWSDYKICSQSDAGKVTSDFWQQL
ncbi:MAG: ATP-dependent DNA helicase [Lachnospiraceae bacterium]|nr:ATP-dependent DNA helicase [Lachnospiraceae bacterium]